MKRVVLTFQLPQRGEQALRQYEKEVEVIQWPSATMCPREWLLEHVEGCDGLLVSLADKIDDELLDKAGSNLKVVSSLSAGFDHVDMPALARRGVRLGLTPDALTEACADLSLMLALMAMRRGGEAMRLVLDGNWPNLSWGPQVMCGRSLTGATVGFLGFGRIAQATLARALPLRPGRALYVTSRPGKHATHDYFNLNGWLPSAPCASLTELAEASDVLFICCALTDKTRNLVDDRFLRKMKPTAVLVNTARGQIVDNDALAAALREGRLFGAGLDVVAGEPDIGADHPLVKEPRCVILPHIGSATVETRGLMAEQCVMNLIKGMNGEEMVYEKELE